MRVPAPKPITQDILTIPEIAFLTDNLRGTVERWRLRTKKEEPVFIEPDGYLGSTPYWRLGRIKAWCDQANPARPYDENAWREHRDAGNFRRKADA